MSTPGCPTLNTTPTVHHPVTAATKKPAGNPGRFTLLALEDGGLAGGLAGVLPVAGYRCTAVFDCVVFEGLLRSAGECGVAVPVPAGGEPVLLGCGAVVAEGRGDDGRRDGEDELAQC